MENKKGEAPPREDLCRNSYESAKDDEVASALNYLSGETGAEQAQVDEATNTLGVQSAAAVRTTAADPLSDPIVVSFDRQPHNSNSSSSESNHRQASEGDYHPRFLEQQDAAAYEPAAKKQRKLPTIAQAEQLI